MDKANSCVFQANYHFIWAVKCRRSVLFGSVEVKLVEVLKAIAVSCGFEVLTARVHDGCHVHVFVSAPPKICISDMVRVLKCNSDRLLFLEFAELKLKLWVVICGLKGMLCVLLAMLLAQKLKTISTDIENSGCLPRKRQVVHFVLFYVCGEVLLMVMAF